LISYLYFSPESNNYSLSKEIKVNTSLKKAFIDDGRPIYKSAIAAGINPNKVSKFICELSKPTDEEKERLARELKRSADELFPENSMEVV
jgi:hypothetical protein